MMMKTEENQHAPLPERAKSARRTWFWTHSFFGVLFIVLASIIYQKTGRMVLALIFAVIGLIEVVNVFTNPFRVKKK